MEPMEQLNEVQVQLVDLWAMTLDWLAKSANQYQLLFIIGVVGFSLALVWMARSLYDQLQGDSENLPMTARDWYLRRAISLIPPAVTFILLSLADQLAGFIVEKSVVMTIARNLSLVWMLVVLIRIFVNNTIVVAVGYWILVPAALLQVFGWFDPVVAYLEEYGFTLGKVEITAYTFVKAIFFVSLVVWIGKLLSNIGERYIRKNPSLTLPTKELLVKLLDVFLAAVLFMATLNLIGIDLTALAVFSGALGVGLGFGLQKIASNFISGIILLSEKTITIDNLVEMDDGIFGYVRKLGARASIVETFDGREVMVPNEDFITSRVANLTHSSNRSRVDVFVGTSYDCNPHRVREIMLKAADDYEDTITDTEEFAPACFLREFGDSSINFLLIFWIPDINKGRWTAQSKVMLDIWDAFEEEGIEIPYPKRDLYFRNNLPLEKPEKPKSDPDTTTESAGKAPESA